MAQQVMEVSPQSSEGERTPTPNKLGMVFYKSDTETCGFLTVRQLTEPVSLRFRSQVEQECQTPGPQCG